jgi:hypothetical protein
MDISPICSTELFAFSDNKHFSLKQFNIERHVDATSHNTNETIRRLRCPDIHGDGTDSIFGTSMTQCWSFYTCVPWR